MHPETDDDADFELETDEQNLGEDTTRAPRRRPRRAAAERKAANEGAVLEPLASRGRLKREVLLGGRLTVIAPRGLEPLNRLLVETVAQAPGLLHGAEAANEPALALAMNDGYAALSLRALDPERSVTFFHYDLWRATQANALACEYGHDAQKPLIATAAPQAAPATGATAPPAAPAFRVTCAAHLEASALPIAPRLIIMTSRKDDEAALTAELLHEAGLALAPGGKLLVATNNPRDKWLGQQLQKLFGNLSIAGHDKLGRVYSVKRTAKSPLAAPLDGDGAVAGAKQVKVGFADLELEFETEVGTFSSDALDAGSRALLETMDPPEPCNAILDLGCGWGGVGILAARLTFARRLTMIDANARAAGCARRNAAQLRPESEGGPHVEVRLEADAESLGVRGELGSYDIVLTNPPYGTDFRVAERFIDVARVALRLGGRLFLVARNNERLIERVGEIFGNVSTERRRGYSIISAIRKN